MNILWNMFISIEIITQILYIKDAPQEPQPGDVTVSTGLRLALVAAEWWRYHQTKVTGNSNLSFAAA